jgi:hypothetical protein
MEFKGRLEKFGEMGEKTGWTVLIISSGIADNLKSGCKTSFRVKGMLDEIPIKGMALIPFGGGDFVLPIRADLRRLLRKEAGSELFVQLTEDTDPFVFDPDFEVCLEEAPEAKRFFSTLAPSHQRYFSKWIADAKTNATKEKRILDALRALALGWDFGLMLRNRKSK